MAATIVKASRAILELSTDGGANFIQVPFFSSIELPSADAPETDIDTIDEGVAKIVGDAPLPVMAVTFSAFVPNLSAHAEIRKARLDAILLQWRVTTKKDLIFTASGASNTIAIATTGIVTFAGDAPDFSSDIYRRRGLVFEVGTNQYTIDEIDSSDVVTAYPKPTSAVSATMGYKIANPSRRFGPFTANVASSENFSLAAGGALESALRLVPDVDPGTWSLVTP